MKITSKKLIISTLLVAFIASSAGIWQYQSVQNKKIAEQMQIQLEQDKKTELIRQARLEAEAARQAAEKQSAPFNKQQLPIDDAASIWVVVNKTRRLNPPEYVSGDLVAPNIALRTAATSPEMKLRREAATALETMTAAAKLSGAQLMLASGYRSYNSQVLIYDREVRAYGQAIADTQSARPGFSEHQTGLAVDLEPVSRQCEIADCFADTAEGKWLALNAPKYGFLMRYTADKTTITGYRAESWHFRYVGTTLTNELQKQGVVTLEEFFGLPPAPNYL